MSTQQSPCLTFSVASEASPLPPKSPTLWPTARATDGDKATRTAQGAATEVARNKGPDLAAVVSVQSPTPKSNPSPAPCITGTFPIASALAESKMLRAIQSLSDAVHSRLSSLAAFLASRTVAPGSDSPAQMIETCGASAAEYLGSYDPATHSLRMSQACLPLNLDGSSTESLATWPRCGMLVSGRLYQLPPLALPTEGNESGLSAEMNWPTATVNDATGSQYAYSGGNHDKPVLKLPGMVLRGPPSTATGRADPVKRSTDGNRHELWATPKAEVDTTRTPNGNPAKDGKILNQQAGGKLNPHWVMTLMGYPPLWAELGRKFITGSRNSKAQATPSCQSAPPSSSTQSGDN